MQESDFSLFSRHSSPFSALQGSSTTRKTRGRKPTPVNNNKTKSKKTTTFKTTTKPKTKAKSSPHYRNFSKIKNSTGTRGSTKPKTKTKTQTKTKTKTKLTPTSKSKTTSSSTKTKFGNSNIKGKIVYNNYIFKGIKRSKSPKYKFEAVFENINSKQLRVIPFGNPNIVDYLTNPDNNYKSFVLSNMKYNPDDLMNAKTIAKFICWNKSKLPESIKDYERAIRSAGTTVRVS